MNSETSSSVCARATLGVVALAISGSATPLFHGRQSHGGFPLATWRIGLDPELGIQMNEQAVEAEVARMRADPIKRQKFLKMMTRCRDPMGIYSDGGCIDASREFPRQLKSIVLL
ncbi:hypothetical protein [Limnohabitans sp.]|jgi:hypothetical protein|uniref:hypothetical protein n=1 Tax=Limnohabitans sp. TaxID=1907725 RepID=UPI0037C0C650